MLGEGDWDDVSRRAVTGVNPSQKGRPDIKSDLFYGEDDKTVRGEWSGWEESKLIASSCEKIAFAGTFFFWMIEGVCRSKSPKRCVRILSRIREVSKDYSRRDQSSTE